MKITHTLWEDLKHLLVTDIARTDPLTPFSPPPHFYVRIVLGIEIPTAVDHLGISETVFISRSVGTEIESFTLLNVAFLPLSDLRCDVLGYFQ